MRSQRAAHEKYPDKVDEMNTDERLAKLEVKVEHLQSDVTEVKTDVRELKTDVRELRDEMHAQGKELRGEMHAITVGLEKLKGQLWVALALLFVLHVLTIGGVPAAIASAFKLP
jgi:predicted  nucleic acid-binding Zn-ribbon protein